MSFQKNFMIIGVILLLHQDIGINLGGKKNFITLLKWITLQKTQSKLIII